MRALITNDDGVHSTGIRVLARAARAAGLDVLVAAPHEERSGASAALSALEEGGRLVVDAVDLDDDLAGVPALAVHASPAMISLVAARGAFGDPPDVVLSGVNHGPNAGQATLFSGTVGAAMTATTLGIPALAVSLASMNHRVDQMHWLTASDVTALAVKLFLETLDTHADDPYTLNVNIPDVSPDAFRGLRAAELSPFGAHQAEIGVPGEGFVTVTFTEVAEEAAPATDLALVRDGWASVTALKPPSRVERVDLSTRLGS